MKTLRTTFNLAEPPRIVPWSVRVAALVGGVGIAGWLVLGTAGIGATVFISNADMAFLHFRGPLEQAQGTVTHVAKTRMSEGGSRRSKSRPICEFGYRFKVSLDGPEYAGVSYQTGDRLREGDAASIEYVAADPTYSRIVGMRTRPFPPFVAIFGVLSPLVGLCLVVVRWRKGRRALGLLADGRLALGTFKSKTATRTRINSRRVFRLTFDFQADDRQAYTCVTRTHRPEQLEGDEPQKLLYLPENPDAAMMFDTLPGAPRTDDLGQIAPRTGAAILLLLPPIACVAANAGCLIYRLAG